ncbi:MAG: hypothetical protein ACI4I9_00910 [Porcipelethomonas sp.]
MNETNNQINIKQKEREIPFLSKFTSAVLSIISFLFMLAGGLAVFSFFYLYLTGAGYPEGSISAQLGMKTNGFMDILLTLTISFVLAAIVILFYSFLKMLASAIRDEYDIPYEEYYQQNTTHVCDIPAKVFLILSIIGATGIFLVCMIMWFISAVFSSSIIISVLMFTGMLIFSLIIGFLILSIGCFWYGVFKLISSICWRNSTKRKIA